VTLVRDPSIERNSLEIKSRSTVIFGYKFKKPPPHLPFRPLSRPPPICAIRLLAPVIPKSPTSQLPLGHPDMPPKRARFADHIYAGEEEESLIKLDSVSITMTSKRKKARVFSQSYGVKRTDVPDNYSSQLEKPAAPTRDVPLQAAENIPSDNGAKASNLQDPPPKKVVISY
jgi:hypothetical protein